MWQDYSNWTAPVHVFQAAIADRPELTAKVRRTETGVRIKFSDGRIAWLDRDLHSTENGFMSSVIQWIQRHGAHSIEVEPG